MKWLRGMFSKRTPPVNLDGQSQNRNSPQYWLGIAAAGANAKGGNTKTLGYLVAAGEWAKVRAIVGDCEHFAAGLGDLNTSRHVDISGHHRSVLMAMLALTSGQPHLGDDVQMAKDALCDLMDAGGRGTLKAGDVLMTLLLTACFFDDHAKSGAEKRDIDLADMGKMIDKLLGPFASASLEQLFNRHDISLPPAPQPPVAPVEQASARTSKLGVLIGSCRLQDATEVLTSIMMKAPSCPDISSKVQIRLAADHKAGGIRVLEYALTSDPHIRDGMRRAITDIARQIGETGTASVSAMASLTALNVIVPAVNRNRQLAEAAGPLVDALFLSLPSSLR